jgi:hypothetical protein
MTILYITGLQQELAEFDRKHQNHMQPLPKLIYDWRRRWIKAIELAKSKHEAARNGNGKEIEFERKIEKDLP